MADKNTESTSRDDLPRDKRGNIYEISERKDSLSADVGKYKFLLRQIILYRIKGTDVWIYTKWGCLGVDEKSVIEKVNNAEAPKPETFNYNLKSFHFGQLYETDDQGAIVGDWPVIGKMSIETDMVNIVTGEDIQNYKLWTLPIPFRGIVDMKKTTEDGFE